LVYRPKTTERYSATYCEVTPSVVDMCYRPLAYDDPDTATTSAGRPTQHDKVKREISVDDATVRLAAALDLGRG
jgi:hypothetical protein